MRQPLITSLAQFFPNGHNHRVQCMESCGVFTWPVGLGSARHLAKHFVVSGGAKLAHLRRLALPAVDTRAYP